MNKKKINQVQEEFSYWAKKGHEAAMCKLTKPNNLTKLQSDAWDEGYQNACRQMVD